MSRQRKIIRYSEAFKLEVLQQIDQGDVSIEEARRKYGIRGSTTIQKWALKYGKFGVIPKRIRVEKPDEADQIKALQAQIRQLKAALADTVLDMKIAESTLEVICEHQGWDVEQIKKKAGESLSARPSKKDKA